MQKLLAIPWLVLQSVSWGRLSALTLKNTINKKFDGLSESDLKTLESQVIAKFGWWGYYWTYTLSTANGNENNIDEWLYEPLFKEVVAPTLEISRFSPLYYGQRKAIVRNFISCLQERIKGFDKEAPISATDLIEHSTISRIGKLEWFWVVVAHLEESNKLVQGWFEHVAYSEMMKAMEKLLKKMCLMYHRETYTKAFSETPINAKMEDIIKFLRKLWWHERQYVKPIDDLNKFANDDKHTITQRWNISSVSQNDYSWVFWFILDWIDWHSK